MSVLPPRGLWFYEWEGMSVLPRRLGFDERKGKGMTREGRRPKSWIPLYLRWFSYDELKEMTDDFSCANFLGRTDSTNGRVFRGRIAGQTVVVETWERVDDVDDDLDQAYLRVWQTQIQLLSYSNYDWPHIAKLIGYCKERPIVGVVYNCEAIDTLHNMLPGGGDFKWKRRMRVALQIACVLARFHAPPNFPVTVRGLEPASILLDKNFNPVIFDLGVASGGRLGRVDTGSLKFGHNGYTDSLSKTDDTELHWDVYSFGVLLLSLMTKKYGYISKSPQLMHLVWWASSVTHPIVHDDFLKEAEYYVEDGNDLSKLALSCVDSFARRRPEMRDVVKRLEGLQVVQEYCSDMLDHRPPMKRRASELLLCVVP